MKEKSQTRIRRASQVVLATFCGLFVFAAIGAVAFGMETGSCSILQASCRYDPRTEQPSMFFIKQGPEPFVLQYIRGQIQQSGTFPPTAGSSVVSITPVLVTAHGFNTDWHVVAEVTIEIKYTDGHTQQPVFEVFAYDGNSFMGIENSIIETRFGLVTKCDQNSPGGIWHCHQ
jgi:hypothetical protein